METRKAFAVKSEPDFEKFVSELTARLKQANHEGGLAVATAFESLVRSTKRALPYKRPRTLYVVESRSRVAWEENHGRLGTAPIFQIPKGETEAPLTKGETEAPRPILHHEQFVVDRILAWATNRRRYIR